MDLDLDPALQLQLMQEMSRSPLGSIPGMQGQLMQGLTGLSAQAMNYNSPIAGNPLPDMSPLAPLNLGQYGIGGTLASIAGNQYLTGMAQQQGLLPLGNAGSYMQAQRTREFLTMRRDVGNQIAGGDEQAIYSSLRGVAALSGMSFDAQQRQAARSLARTISSAGPTLAMIAPEIMDAMGGRKGSIQAMGAQMMEANRYRVDPLTGQMGYGAEANASLITNVFDTMFADDNMAKMSGVRAGDVGQMYRTLAAEGLVGTRGNVRSRTLDTLYKLRSEGTDLGEIAKEAGVSIDNDSNLASLSNAELNKLRSTDAVKSRFSREDSRVISGQLQGYVDSIKAMREVFGENGDTNAPIPKLVNALKAFTSGQMQRFDANQLNQIVRDAQSMSQLSGKSISQIAQMYNTADQITGVYAGPNGTSFNPTLVNIGVNAGRAFDVNGPVTGYGAYSREQVEQASMTQAGKAIGSKMFNATGALARIAQGGGFADNAAGQQLQSIYEAMSQGRTVYADPVTGQEKLVPTQDNEIFSLVANGGAVGVGGSDFQLMLSERETNKRFASENPELLNSVFARQGSEFEAVALRHLNSRMANTDLLKGIDPTKRQAISRRFSAVAFDTLSNLSMQDTQNADVRNKEIADALLIAAQEEGVNLSPAEARALANQTFGSVEKTAQAAGHDSYTSLKQVHGRDAIRELRGKQAETRARSQINETMSNLGPKGSMLQRFFDALQNQGKEGANLETFLADTFMGDKAAARDQLKPLMQEIQTQVKEVRDLEGQFDGATAADREIISNRINGLVTELNAKVTEVKSIEEQHFGKQDGYGDGSSKNTIRSANELGAGISQISTRQSLQNFGAGVNTRSFIPTDEARKQREEAIRKKHGGMYSESEVSDLALRQLLAEDQLKALDISQADLNSDYVLERGQFAGEDQLQGKLRATTDPMARMGLIEEFLSTKSVRDAYNATPEEIEARRLTAIENSKTAEGQAAKDAIGTKLADSIDARKAFLSDDAAILRAGTAGLDAARENKRLEEDLQSRANRYYGGDIAAMVTDPTAIQNIDLARKDFAAMSDADRGKLYQTLIEFGVDVKDLPNPDVLKDPANFKYFQMGLGIQSKKDAHAIVQSSIKMARAATGVYDDPNMDKVQNDALNKIVQMQEDGKSVDKVQASLRRSGKNVTTSEIRAVLSGQKKLSDIGFDSRALGISKDEQLQAQKNRSQIVALQKRIETARLSGSDTSALETALANKEGNLAELADHYGFDNSQEFMKQLTLLDENKNFVKNVEDVNTMMLDKNLTPEDIAKRKEKQAELRKEADKLLNAEVKDPYETVGKLFGGKNSEKIAAELKGLGSPAAEANTRMVAEAVGKLNLEANAAGTSDIERLDNLRTEYESKKSMHDKAQMANRLNMSVTDMDRTFKQVEFLDGARTQEDAMQRMRDFAKTNIEETVKQEEQNTMKITGELVFSGDVKGEGTINDGHAVNGAR